MIIYLAGNYAMSKEERERERERLYSHFFHYRLLSYYEMTDGRFASRQWSWLREVLICQ